MLFIVAARSAVSSGQILQHKVSNGHVTHCNNNLKAAASDLEVILRLSFLILAYGKNDSFCPEVLVCTVVCTYLVFSKTLILLELWPTPFYLLYPLSGLDAFCFRMYCNL